MFTRHVEVSPFGNLSAEGQSKIWETEIDIPPLGQGFVVRVWGGRSGPSEAQARAFSNLLLNASEIRETSAFHSVSYLHECGIVPSCIELDNTSLWAYLAPSFIEVHDSEAYAAGCGEPGQIAISVGFQTPWEDEHLLQIGTLDGKFDAIYSE